MVYLSPCNLGGNSDTFDRPGGQRSRVHLVEGCPHGDLLPRFHHIRRVIESGVHGGLLLVLSQKLLLRGRM